MVPRQNRDTASHAAQSLFQTATEPALMPTEDHTDWGNRPEDETTDYNEEIFWEPMDSDPDSNRRRISPTTSEIVKDAISHTMTMEKQRSIKRK